MLYKFRSKATGDVIMLGAHGDTLLRLLGREPAAQGIFEASAMPQLWSALEQAIASAEQPVAADAGADPDANDEPRGARTVTLRQRLWPMIEMLRRSHAAGEPVVWGV